MIQLISWIFIVFYLFQITVEESILGKGSR